MDVSNGTGEDTHYRTGSDTTKLIQWIALPPRKVLQCPDPKSSWTIFFKLQDGEILSETFPEPMAAVALVKNGSHYRITVTRKTAQKPARPPKPAKPANSAKRTKAKNAA